MITFKNRTIDPDRSLLVYRNLRKNEFSVMQDGLVVGHTKDISLQRCQFIVRQSGHQKFLQTGRKNVHAFVEGMLSNKKKPKGTVPIRYNPEIGTGFFDPQGNFVLTASHIWLHYPHVLAQGAK